MSHHPDDHPDDVEIVPMNLPLDRETVSWLSRVSKNDADAAQVVANIVKMIAEEDDLAHATRH